MFVWRTYICGAGREVEEEKILIMHYRSRYNIVSKISRSSSPVMLFKRLEANYSKTNEELKRFVSWRKKIGTGRGLLLFIISFVKLFDPSCKHNFDKNPKLEKHTPHFPNL